MSQICFPLTIVYLTVREYGQMREQESSAADNQPVTEEKSLPSLQRELTSFSNHLHGAKGI